MTNDGERQRLLEELENEFRASQNATDIVDQAAADLIGVNRTDARCLDVLDRLGTVTAGRLAEESGLTTGAVTAMIDRLESAGHVRRIRDNGDRRRVLVELTPKARREARNLYAPIARRWEEIAQDLTIEQIEFMIEITRRGREANLELAEILRAKLAAKEAAAIRRARRRVGG